MEKEIFNRALIRLHPEPANAGHMEHHAAPEWEIQVQFEWFNLFAHVEAVKWAEEMHAKLEWE